VETIVLVIAVSTALSAFVAIGIGRYRAGKGSSEHNSLLGYFFSSVGAFYSFLLAFVVVNTWSNLTGAQANIYEESSTLPGIYYDVSVFPEEHRIAVQTTLKAYARAVIDDEWPAMDEGESSQEVGRLLSDLRRQVLAIQPQNSQQSSLYGAMLGHMSKLATTRRVRLNQARPSIPTPFWIGLVGGGVMLIGVGMAFHAPKIWMHVALMTVLTLVVSSSLCLARTMDHPFHGGIKVPPTAFEIAIRQMGESP
jgi:hypothetical protein